MVTFEVEKSLLQNEKQIREEVETSLDRIKNTNTLVSYGISEKHEKLWLLLKGKDQSQILQLLESYIWVCDYNYEINELFHFHQVVEYSDLTTN